MSASKHRGVKFLNCHCANSGVAIDSRKVFSGGKTIRGKNFRELDICMMSKQHSAGYLLISKEKRYLHSESSGGDHLK